MFGHRRRSDFIIFRIGIRTVFGTHGLERYVILLGGLLSLGIDADHGLRHRLRTVAIFRIEVVDELLAVTLLREGRHLLRHHRLQFLFGHHSRCACAHDCQER